MTLLSRARKTQKQASSFTCSSSILRLRKRFHGARSESQPLERDSDGLGPSQGQTKAGEEQNKSSPAVQNKHNKTRNMQTICGFPEPIGKLKLYGNSSRNVSFPRRCWLSLMSIIQLFCCMFSKGSSSPEQVLWETPPIIQD